MKIKIKFGLIELEFESNGVRGRWNLFVARYRLRRRYSNPSEMPILLLLFFCICYLPAAYLYSNAIARSTPAYYHAVTSATWDSTAPLAIGTYLAVSFAACSCWILVYQYGTALLAKSIRRNHNN